MSVRQYIGARYVTKIYENSLDSSSAEWEASVTYEPLTLVTYNNGSYLSKKDVPGSIGNPASNPVYWVQTGFYNGQISNLQNQIDALDQEIDNIINATRKFWFIGDSFLQLTDNWGEVVDSIFGTTDSTFTYDGGAGFVHKGNNTNKDFSELASDENVPDDITDVIIIGGCNDCNVTDYTLIPTKIDSLISVVKSKAPNAEIWIAYNATYCNGQELSPGFNAGKAYIVYAMNEFETEVPLHTKCHLIKSPTFSILNKKFVSDGIHPTTTGSTRLGKAIASEIQGTPWYETAYVNASDGDNILWETCRNDYIMIKPLLGCVLYSGTPISLSPLTDLNIYAGNKTFYPPLCDGHYKMKLKLRAKDSSNNLTYFDAMVTMSAAAISIYSFHNSTISNIVEIMVNCTETFIFPIYSL